MSETVIAGDEYARRAIAKTIYKFHKIKVDWQLHTWQQMSDLYQRLNQAKNIKRKLGIDIDWQNRSVQELTRIYVTGRMEYNE